MTALSQPVAAAPALVTADEFTVRSAHPHAELVKGVGEEYPVPFAKHGQIGRLIGNHLLDRRIRIEIAGEQMGRFSGST